jgi:hypothetical protein
MNMKGFSRICFLSVALIFGACTKDIPGIDEEQNRSALVRFMTIDVDAAATRGTPITAASQMTTMGVFASYTGTSDWTDEDTPNRMFNQELNYMSGTWSYPTGDEEYWKYTGFADRYTFFAYAPYQDNSDATGNGITVNGTSGDEGVPTLTYTVPVKVENQPYLMVAVPRKNIRPTGSPISLGMEHALTCVGFYIAGQGERVTSIKVEGVATRGTLAMDGEHISWTTEDPTTTDFSASLNYDAGQAYYTTTETMTTSLIRGDGYLMMIPQTLAEGAKVVVTYSDNTTKEFAFGTDTWLPGKRVTYNQSINPTNPINPINPINPTKPIRFRVKIDDWDDSTNPVMR